MDDPRVVIALIAILVAVFMALVGAVWWLLNWKIDKGDQYNSDKIDKVESNLKIEARRIADNVHELRGSMSPWFVRIEASVERIKEKIGIK